MDNPFPTNFISLWIRDRFKFLFYTFKINEDQRSHIWNLLRNKEKNKKKLQLHHEFN